MTRGEKSDDDGMRGKQRKSGVIACTGYYYTVRVLVHGCGHKRKRSRKTNAGIECATDKKW